jgi:flagellar biosynthesis/type III secretory pathway protein FliH
MITTPVCEIIGGRFDKFFDELKFKGIYVTNDLVDLIENLEADVIEAAESKYTSEYEAAYDEGYEQGYDNANETEYEQGYNDGYEAGYEEGIQDELNQ